MSKTPSRDATRAPLPAHVSPHPSSQARLEHLLGNMNAPDLDEAPEFPKDAGVKARKQLKTLHNQRLRGAFVKLTDTHLVQAAQKQFKKHAEQWGVVVRKVPKHKEGRKSPIFHTYVRVLRCNQERYRRWVAARKSAEAKPAADAAAARGRRRGQAGEGGGDSWPSGREARQARDVRNRTTMYEPRATRCTDHASSATRERTGVARRTKRRRRVRSTLHNDETNTAMGRHRLPTPSGPAPRLFGVVVGLKASSGMRSSAHTPRRPRDRSDRERLVRRRELVVARARDRPAGEGPSRDASRARILGISVVRSERGAFRDGDPRRP